MSYTPNTIWLENAVDNFDDAVASGNFNFADEIIKDIADNGFTKESVQLAEELVKEIMQEKLEDIKLDLI